MVQTRTKRPLNAEDHRIIGQLLFETLSGEISQETWDATYKLGDPLQIPQPYGHLIGYTQGYALSNKELAHDLQEEVRGVCIQLLEERWEHPDARSINWISMYAFLQHILEGSDPETSLRANIDAGILPEVEKAPAWAGPLIQHAQASSDDDKELTLELLGVLENIIQKRRAELSK